MTALANDNHPGVVGTPAPTLANPVKKLAFVAIHAYNGGFCTAT